MGHCKTLFCCSVVSTVANYTLGYFWLRPLKQSEHEKVDEDYVESVVVEDILIHLVFGFYKIFAAEETEVEVAKGYILKKVSVALGLALCEEVGFSLSVVDNLEKADTVDFELTD
uniref:Trafficking protein particle complex subunit n=1 Tax=Ascaris lumbricoides TaxID=6252 RepID=A0A0M3IEW8_ASCLU